MKHVFQKPESVASVKDLIDAKEDEDAMLDDL